MFNDGFFSFLLSLAIVFLLLVAVGSIACRAGDCRTDEEKLKEASTSAQIKDACVKFETVAVKDTPIKCLQFFEIGIRK